MISSMSLRGNAFFINNRAISFERVISGVSHVQNLQSLMLGHQPVILQITKDASALESAWRASL